MGMTLNNDLALVSRLRAAGQQDVGRLDLSHAMSICTRHGATMPQTRSADQVLAVLEKAMGLVPDAPVKPVAVVDDTPPPAPKPRIVANLRLPTAIKRALAEAGLNTLDEVREYDATLGLDGLAHLSAKQANRVRAKVGLKLKDYA